MTSSAASTRCCSLWWHWMSANDVDHEVAQGPTQTSRHNLTLDRGLSIMELLLDDDKGLTVLEISNRLEIAASSIYRIVRLLRQREWLAVDPPGVYRFGNRLLTAVSRAETGSRLIAAANPVLVDLTARTQETSLLTVVSGLSAVCMLRVEGKHAIRVSFQTGAVLPLHAGASSTVLLAFAAAELVDRICAAGLIRYTPATVTEPTQLSAKLAAIREQGYAESDSEMDVGVVSVAAPVVTSPGQLPTAAVSVVGPSQRLNHTYLPDVRAAVLDAARLISQSMSGMFAPNHPPVGSPSTARK